MQLFLLLLFLLPHYATQVETTPAPVVPGAVAGFAETTPTTLPDLEEEVDPDGHRNPEVKPKTQVPDPETPVPHPETPAVDEGPTQDPGNLVVNGDTESEGGGMTAEEIPKIEPTLEIKKTDEETTCSLDKGTLETDTPCNITLWINGVVNGTATSAHVIVTTSSKTDTVKCEAVCLLADGLVTITTTKSPPTSGVSIYIIIAFGVFVVLAGTGIFSYFVLKSRRRTRMYHFPLNCEVEAYNLETDIKPEDQGTGKGIVVRDNYHLVDG